MGDHMLRRRLSTVQRTTTNPQWNQVLRFNVPSQLLGHIHLHVSVVDYDLLGQGELLGECRLGPNIRGSAGNHWDLMMEQLQEPTPMWHTLTLP